MVWPRKRGGLCLALVMFAATAVFETDAIANTLPEPAGEVILTVSGKIKHSNVEGQVRFDRAMLEGIGIRILETSTPRTDGRHRFEGVLARDLLAAVGATGDHITAKALNDYEIDIPIDVFLKYPVIFALKMNGSYLRVRDNGPIWIIYPRDLYQELDNPRHTPRWVGQLKEIVVK